MERTRLDQLLTELRTELADTGDMDPGTRESLRRLADDLDRLGGDDRAGENDRPESLNDLARRFDSEHPRLGAILAQVIDTLGKMGI